MRANILSPGIASGLSDPDERNLPLNASRGSGPHGPQPLLTLRRFHRSGPDARQGTLSPVQSISVVVGTLLRA